MSDLFSGANMTIGSSWQSEKKFKHVACDMRGPGTLESEAQTTISALTITETTDKTEGVDPRSHGIPQARPAGSTWVYPGPHFDDESVFSFLKDVNEETVDELIQNTKSSAFDSYEPNWKPKKENIALSASLQPPFALDREWHVTGLSWNSTGTLLASCYGLIDSVAWCQSKGYACVWNIGALLSGGDSAASAQPSSSNAGEGSNLQRTMSQSNMGGSINPHSGASKPAVTVEADSYITAIAFHPIQPSLLAGATYNGEILIWNIAEEGGSPKPMSSLGYANGPREPVTKLQWLQNLREARESHRYVLCSASEDGKIMFWTPTNKLAEALSGYEVQNKKRALVGVQSMGFVNASTGGMGSGGQPSVPGVENVMLLGTESGEVLRTKPGRSMAPVNPQTGALGVLEIDHFDPHLGPVHAVDCSPFFRNLFLTCASDGAVRLYSTLERHQLLTLQPSLESKHYVYGAQFSPARPSVFAAVSRSSHLHLFDLEASRVKPVATVDAGTEGSACVSLAFNRNDTSVLATGDCRGAVRIWLLSSVLCDATDLERAAVREGTTTTSSSPASNKESGAQQQQQQQQQQPGASNDAHAQRQLFGFAV